MHELRRRQRLLLGRRPFSGGFNGCVFITNLRLEWIRLFRSRSNRGGKPPIVVQLLGTRDSMVSEQDSRDILAFPNTAYVKVAGANHRTIIRLSTERAKNRECALTAEGRERYTLIRNALLGEPESLGLRPDAGGAGDQGHPGRPLG